MIDELCLMLDAFSDLKVILPQKSYNELTIGRLVTSTGSSKYENSTRLGQGTAVTDC